MVNVRRSVGEIIVVDSATCVMPAMRKHPATFTMSVPYGKNGPSARPAQRATR